MIPFDCFVASTGNDGSASRKMGVNVKGFVLSPLYLYVALGSLVSIDTPCILTLSLSDGSYDIISEIKSSFKEPR